MAFDTPVSCREAPEGWLVSVGYGISLILHDGHDYDRIVSELADDPVFDSIILLFRLSCADLIERTPPHHVPRLMGMYIQHLAGVIQSEIKKALH